MVSRTPVEVEIGQPLLEVSDDIGALRLGERSKERKIIADRSVLGDDFEDHRSCIGRIRAIVQMSPDPRPHHVSVPAELFRQPRDFQRRDTSQVPLLEGLIGLHDALKKTDDLGPDDREAVVDRMMEVLGPLNYFPDGQIAAYRVAFWREFMRHRARDFSAWYSELPVTVRGEPGDERDRFVALVKEILAAHELKPVFTLAAGGRSPELVINDEVVASGPQNRASLDRAVRRTLSHW